MRVVIAGAAEARLRLREQLSAAGIEVVGEVDTVAGAQSWPGIDAVVLAPDGRRPPDLEPLTARELEVLQIVAEGLSNKSIAARLGISDQTVKFHVASIYGKLGASNRTDAVRRALHRGIITI